MHSQACLLLLLGLLWVPGGVHGSPWATHVRAARATLAPDPASDASAAVAPAPPSQGLQSDLLIRFEPPAMQASQPLGPVPRDFAGLSIEKVMILEAAYGPSFLSPNNTELLRLLQLAGVQSLRVGGATGNFDNCTNGTAYPFTHQPCLLHYTPTTSDIQRLADFVLALSGPSLKPFSLMYMLSLRISTPKEAAAEAETLSGLLANTSVSLYFEMGNEEDGLGWNFRQYTAVVTPYLAAVRAAVPGAMFSGPDASFNYRWPVFAAQGLAFNLSTFHSYPGGPAKWIQCTLENLLHLSYTGYSAWLRSWENGVGVPRRITEMHTCSGGGKAGVSDTFGAAVWWLEYMHFMAKEGVAGVNMHWGPANAPYNPIFPTNKSDTYTLKPHFNSLLAWTLLNPGGGHYVNVSVEMPGLVKVYAFGLSNGDADAPAAGPLLSPAPGTSPGSAGQGAGVPLKSDVKLAPGQGVGIVIMNLNLTGDSMVTLDKTAEALSMIPKQLVTGLWFEADNLALTNGTGYGFSLTDCATGGPLRSSRSNLNNWTALTFNECLQQNATHLVAHLPPGAVLMIKVLPESASFLGPKKWALP